MTTKYHWKVCGRISSSHSCPDNLIADIYSDYNEMPSNSEQKRALLSAFSSNEYYNGAYATVEEIYYCNYFGIYQY